MQHCGCVGGPILPAPHSLFSHLNSLKGLNSGRGATYRAYNKEGAPATRKRVCGDSAAAALQSQGHQGLEGAFWTWERLCRQVAVTAVSTAHTQSQHRPGWRPSDTKQRGSVNSSSSYRSFSLAGPG